MAHLFSSVSPTVEAHVKLPCFCLNRHRLLRFLSHSFSLTLVTFQTKPSCTRSRQSRFNSRSPRVPVSFSLIKLASSDPNLFLTHAPSVSFSVLPFSLALIGFTPLQCPLSVSSTNNPEMKKHIFHHEFCTAMAREFRTLLYNAPCKPRTQEVEKTTLVHQLFCSAARLSCM